MTQAITTLDMTAIIPGDNGAGHQDRTIFDPASLAELAQSIQEHGLLQPITVRQIGESDLFQIVAGERRYRACELLGWLEIPAIVADVTADEAAALMKEIIGNQMGFWQQAAEAWDRLGKPFKRQECEAAAQALQFAFATL